MTIRILHPSQKASAKPSGGFRIKRTWVGMGKASIPPRNGRKVRNDKWEVTDEVLNQIMVYASRNLNKEQIAYLLNISPDTLQKRCKEDPEVDAAVSEALKKGQAKGTAVVVNKLHDMAVNGNLGAICFMLKNKAGWRDYFGHEHSGPGGGPIQSETTVKKEYSDNERGIKLMSLLAQVEHRLKEQKKSKHRIRIKEEEK